MILTLAKYRLSSADELALVEPNVTKISDTKAPIVNTKGSVMHATRPRFPMTAVKII
jgi:hypothetical protein